MIATGSSPLHGAGAPFPFGQVFFDAQSGWHEAWWGQECLGLAATEAEGWEMVRARRDAPAESNNERKDNA
jgi:hypothetical protein